MKKILSVLSVTVLSVIVFTACGQNMSRTSRNSTQNTTSGQAESMVGKAENAVENTADTVLNAVTPDTRARADKTATQNKSGQSSIQDKANTQNFIGEDKAKQLALDKAGVSAGDVIFDRTELENDDGIWVYEIEFKSKTAEYDAEIKAEDGSFLEWEVDKY